MEVFQKKSKYYFVVMFFVRFLVLYLVWFLVYDLYLQREGTLDRWLIMSQSFLGTQGLQLFGYKTYLAFVANKFGLISFDDGRSIRVSHYCDGLVLFALYSGFIISFPKGSFWNKTFQVLIGILAIYVANVVRIVVLCIIFIEARPYLEFNHKYVFTSLIYIMIFFLWKTWIDKTLRTHGLTQNKTVV